MARIYRMTPDEIRDEIALTDDTEYRSALWHALALLEGDDPFR